MSNTAMTLFQNGAGVPAYLKTLELDEVTKALMGGSSGKRISIRGSVFRLMVDGKEISVNEDRAMNMVIVNANNGISRAYYDHAYVEGENTAPTCSSDDGKTPRADSETPQAKTCATCPQNIKGSGKEGGRACGFSQRLAVVLENDLEGDVYQLNLPSMSIFGSAENGKMPLQAYVKLLASHGLPVTAVVTEMRFDTNASTPKLTFKAIRPLTEEELATVKEQGASEAALQAVSSVPAVSDGVSKKQDADEEFETAAPVVQQEEAPKKRASKPKPVPEANDPISESAATKVKSVLEEIEEWDD